MSNEEKRKQLMDVGVEHIILRRTLLQQTKSIPAAAWKNRRQQRTNGGYREQRSQSGVV